MVIPFAIRGMAFANGQGIVACSPREFPFPFPFPQNSLGGGGQHPVTIFPPKKTPTHTVTEIRCHYSNGGMGCGLGSSLFSPKKKLILERLEHLKKLGFFDANCLSDSLAIPKKKLRLRAKFFRIPHSLSHSLKVLRKKNESFLDSHSLRI